MSEPMAGYELATLEKFCFNLASCGGSFPALRSLVDEVKRVRSESERLRDALKKHCQCLFEDGEMVEECHYHACQRFVRMENGDPSKVTLLSEIDRLKAALESPMEACAKVAEDAQRHHDNHCRPECRCADGYHIAAAIRERMKA